MISGNLANSRIQEGNLVWNNIDHAFLSQQCQRFQILPELTSKNYSFKLIQHFWRATVNATCTIFLECYVFEDKEGIQTVNSNRISLIIHMLGTKLQWDGKLERRFFWKVIIFALMPLFILPLNPPGNVSLTQHDVYLCLQPVPCRPPGPIFCLLLKVSSDCA